MSVKYYYSGIFHYFNRMISIIIGSFFSAQKKEKKIIQAIKQQVNNDNVECLMLRSGRSCLKYLFSDVETSILLPNYSCNVVARAAEGLYIDYYQVDDTYNYSLDEILDYVRKNPRSCVLISSYLNRKSNWKEIVHRIREVSSSATIVFDECQNGLNVDSTAPMKEQVYYVISYNNKMTFGFLGGMIIGTTIPKKEIASNSLKEEIHALYSFGKSTLKDIVNALKKSFRHPEESVISECKGIYSCDIAKPLRISISAAYLAMKYQEESLNRLRKNYEILVACNEIKSTIINGTNECTMPFLPSIVSSDYYGKLPIRGPYGGFTCFSERKDRCFILHNMLDLNVEEK